MEIPDDLIGPAPAAVSRKRGESWQDLALRRQGVDTSQASRSRGMSPLERSYALAQAKAKADAQQGRFDTTEQLRQQEQDLRQKQFEAQQQVHASALKDKQVAIDQTGGLLNKIEQIAQDPASPRGSQAFYAKVLGVAGQFPAAIHNDARLGAMMEHYERQHEALGGSPQVPLALSELGQVDPTAPGMGQYLRTLPGKYPEARNDPSFQKLLVDQTKAADASALQVQAKAAGLVADKSTIQGPGGSTTMGIPVDKELASLQREQSLHQRTLNSLDNTYKGIQAMNVDQNDGSAVARKQAMLDDIDAQKIQAKKGLDDTGALIAAKRASGQPGSAGPAGESATDAGAAAGTALISAGSDASQPAAAQDASAAASPVTAENPTPDIHDLANAAIAAGKDPNAVKDRLVQLGGDPAKLNYGN